MYILVNKKDESFIKDEIIERTRIDIDFDNEIDTVFLNELNVLDSILAEFSELDKKIAKFLKNSNAFIITKKEVIDSTIHILTNEKVDYELLCGYDLEAYITKNDTIQNFYQINLICGYANLGSEHYLFNKAKFLEHLKTLNKFNAEYIKFENSGFKKLIQHSLN